KLDIQLAGRHLRLGVGHFFGEIAVLRRARRSATVTATARANLLVLDAGEFHMLMEHDTRIAERVHAVMGERVGPGGYVAQGRHSLRRTDRRNRRMIGRGRSVTSWAFMQLKITGFERHVDDELCSRSLLGGLAMARLGGRQERTDPRQHEGDLYDA